MSARVRLSPQSDKRRLPHKNQLSWQAAGAYVVLERSCRQPGTGLGGDAETGCPQAIGLPLYVLGTHLTSGS